MLMFDVSFHPDGALGCVLWADETVMKRDIRRVEQAIVLDDVTRASM